MPASSSARDGRHRANINGWRRNTFGGLNSAFQQAPESAPSVLATSASATAAEAAHWTQQSKLPLPAFPGALQMRPSQQPGWRRTVG